jgi:membrane protein
MPEKLRELMRFLAFTWRNYVDDGCQARAGSLTYLTLFAVVPLLTVVYTMLSLVPAFSSIGTDIQDWIFNNFLPATGAEVKDALTHFSNQARSLTVVGILFLAATAYLMLKNIEKTFNGIWHTRTNRQGLANFLLYWALLSLGPLLIGLGFFISTYLLSLAMFVEEVDGTGISHQLLSMTPFILEAATFTLFFLAVPNTRVQVKHAAIGGLVTAIAFESAKLLFTAIVKHTSYTLIYGAFAAVPLFLLWINLCWLIVLAGAELVHALGSYQPQSARRYHPLIVSVGLLQLFHQRHCEGTTVTDHDIQSTPWLLGQQKLPARQWQELRNAMLANGLIHTTEDGEYILGKDLYSFTLWDLAGMIPDAWQPLNTAGLEPEMLTAPDTQPEWYKRTRKLLLDSDKTRISTMDTNLASLVATIEPNRKIPCAILAS